MNTEEIEWAKKEMQRFLEHNNLDDKVYSGILEAFKNIYSSQDFVLARRVMKRLLEEKPLSLLTDDPDEWRECLSISNSIKTSFQNRRYYSLFKDVFTDGTVKYFDTERTVCIDIDTGHRFSYKLANDLVDGIYPIDMPYTPPPSPFKVFVRAHYADDRIDFIGVYSLLSPLDRITYINKFYVCNDKERFEITEREFNNMYNS